MKRAIVFVLSCLFSISAFAQHTKKDLVGKWEGTDNANKTGTLIFKDNSKVDLDLAGRLMRDLDYKIDLTKTPAPLDITIKTLDGKQQMILKCLIQFIDKNTLKWQIFEGDNRPSNFDSKALSDAITLILKRKKT